MSLLPRKLNSQWKVASVRDARGKHNLRYAMYQNSPEPKNRYIVFLNGRTEWIEKSLEVPQWLGLPEDCGYLTIDHRGQGASSGQRAYIESYDDYVSDTAAVISEAIGNAPYSLLSHSMGGLIGMYGTLQQKLTPHTAVHSAPLFMLPNDPVHRKIAKPFSKLLTKVGLGKLRSGGGHFHKDVFEENSLTHFYDMYEVIQNSPYYVPSATFSWVSSTFAAIDYIFDKANIEKLSAPTLVLSASEDEVVDILGHRRWIESASSLSKVDVALETIHGARHELLSEIPEYREQAIDRIKNWFADFLS